MKVLAIKCPKCKSVVYSRTRHDMRWCECGNVAIDGGFEYTKISSGKSSPEPFKLEVKATKQKLYDDWNLCKDEFGLIKEKK